MNTAITSRENILAKCRQLVSDQGLLALNMRAVAKACDVALGSIYYYFPSKDDLLVATIESVWEDIFCWDWDWSRDKSFPLFIDQLFAHLAAGMKKYPNFFTIHSVSFSAQGQEKGHASMQDYLAGIKEKMLVVLQQDPAVDPKAFTPTFPAEAFIDFILMSMVALLLQNRQDCSILLELIKRTIY